MSGVELFDVPVTTMSNDSVYLRKEPLLLGGPVQQGFGRGGKMLGCPTANIAVEPFEGVLANLPGGIYFGWSSLDKCEAAPQGKHCKMVMSIGWNPFFNNEKKSIEPHLIQEFPDDFYGVELRLVVIGFIRLEENFPSVELLIEAIANDIRVASEAMELKETQVHQSHDYLRI